MLKTPKERPPPGGTAAARYGVLARGPAAPPAPRRARPAPSSAPPGGRGGAHGAGRAGIGGGV